MLVTGLAQTPGLEIISGERLDEVIKDLGQKVDAMDRSQMLEVARRSGASALVTGSVFKSASDVRIDVRIQDVASGRVLAAHSVNGSNVFPLADDLAGRIRNSLNVNITAPARAITDIASNNLEAYRLYTEGMEAYRNVRGGDARKLLEQAVKLDPSFAAAFYYLARLQDANDPARAEDHRRRFRQLTDRAPERLRLSFQAYEAERAGDFAKATNVLESLVSRYPDEDQAYTDLSRLYLLENREKALSVQARGVEALPYSGRRHASYGYALLARGRYPDAIREFEAYISVSTRRNRTPIKVSVKPMSPPAKPTGDWKHSHNPWQWIRNSPVHFAGRPMRTVCSAATTTLLQHSKPAGGWQQGDLGWKATRCFGSHTFSRESADIEKPRNGWPKESDWLNASRMYVWELQSIFSGFCSLSRKRSTLRR